MADHLGLTTVHVSRGCTTCARTKLSWSTDRIVIIRDLERLRAISAGLLPAKAAANSIKETAATGVGAQPIAERPVFAEL